MDRGVIAALVGRAGYGPDEPVLVAVHCAQLSAVVGPRTAGAPAEPLTAATRVYVASLAKQFTAACAALLARAGRLDIDEALGRWVPELPPWAGTVRLRHLVHHIAGLPPDDQIENMIGEEQDRTNAVVVGALRRFSSLQRPPGTAYAYSNAGYICLALAVERAAGQPLPDLANEHLFDPLGMADTLFWPGPPPGPPRSAPVTPARPAPLSLGDGGAWSTATDLLRWGQAMNIDSLCISALVQTPGRLDDGRTIDYGWGVGIGSHAGHPTYGHGGGWAGIRLLHARVPDLDITLVIVALADHTERRIPLGDALLDHLCSTVRGAAALSD